MERIIFFDPQVTGHHLEFNLHILKEAKYKKHNHIFVFGSEFIDLVDQVYGINVPECFNELKIISIPKWTSFFLNSRNLFFQSFSYSLIAIFYSIRYYGSIIFLLNINPFLRTIPFLFWKIKFSGILFGQQKFIKMDNVISRKMLNSLIRKSNLRKLFILNDKDSIESLRNEYSTEKIAYLPDPIHVENLHLEIVEPKNRIILLFIGVINSNKGIFEILEALFNTQSTINTLIEIRIIGNPNPKYKSFFQNKLDSFLKRKSDKILITVKIEYVSKKIFLNELIKADYILQSYTVGQASSGVMGYSMLMNKRIIGSPFGFIGKQLKGYEHGYIFKSMKPNDLETFFENFIFQKSLPPRFNIKYKKNHSFEKFYNIIHT